jgi:hypothetical protein
MDFRQRWNGVTMKQAFSPVAADPHGKWHLGQFTLDPASQEFQRLASVCEAGNPWRCLIATAASMTIGKRMTVRVDHERGTGVMGVTNDGWRFERPLSAEEFELARGFDLDQQLTRPLTVEVNLLDGRWSARPVAPSRRPGARTGASSRGPNNGEGADPAARSMSRSIRARQLAAIRVAHMDAERAAKGG